jgi:hypothetical protein
MDRATVHHDALEFPDGKIVMVTELVEGQHATVLQLPAPARATSEVKLTTETEDATTTVVG